ncbi:MAG: protein kinase domain-containing protein [Planctomycetota bacterium]
MGPYQILSELGRGGMGVVYKAFQPALKRMVALKVLISGEDASEEAIARFQREAEAVAKLGHHPNIVPVHDIGREGRHHYFAMHHVEGKPLDRMIDDGEITPKQAAGIAKKLAEALQHAHQHGVLHRDVKPSNVLMAFPRFESEPSGEPKGEIPNPKSQIPTKSQIPNLNDTGSGRSGRAGAVRHSPRRIQPATAEGASGESGSEPMLTDFGLAKDVESESKMTRSGVTLGTPAYMPPEQAKGLLAEVDERSDVYSLGATLYEMLVLHPPFEGDSIGDIVRKILFHEPVAPRKVNRSVEKDLETICLKCLEKDPDRRFGSAGALASDLGLYLEGRPILARPPGVGEKVQRTLRRHKIASLGVAAAVVALAVGGIFGWLGWASGVREREEAQKRVERLLGKNRAVSAVFRSAETQLGDVVKELREARYVPQARRREITGRLWPEVTAFEKNVPGDSASQAAMLAILGWLKFQAGYEDEAFPYFERSRSVDPDVLYGVLFEAMVWLVRYIEGQKEPATWTWEGNIAFDEVPGETPEMREARAKFEEVLRSFRGAASWEASSAADLSAVLEGFRRIQGQDLRGAEEGLTRALSIPEVAWFEVEIRQARARVRYFMKSFNACREDVEWILNRHSKNIEGLLYRGKLLSAEAGMKRLEGKDPIPSFRKSIQVYDGLIGLLPSVPIFYKLRGNVYLSLGHALRVRGNDPESLFREAIKNFNAALEIHPGDRGAVYNRGNTYVSVAQYFIKRGKDPRIVLEKAVQDFDRLVNEEHYPEVTLLLRGRAYNYLAEWEVRFGTDPSNSIQKSMRDFQEILRRNPEHIGALSSKGEGFLYLGVYQTRAGEDPRESYQQGLDCCARAIGLNPKMSETYFYSANLRIQLGHYVSKRGEPAIGHYRKAAEECTQGLRFARKFPDLLTTRGSAHRMIAQWETKRGKDPVNAYEKALADLDEALRFNPNDAGAIQTLGEVYFCLGEDQHARGDDPVESLERAIREFTRTLQLDPNDVMAFRSRGGCLFRLGEVLESCGKEARGIFHRAIEDYSEVLSRNPRDRETLPNRASVRLMIARLQMASGEDPRETLRMAIEDCNTSLRLYPQNGSALANRGSAYKILADQLSNRGEDFHSTYEKSIADLSEAIRIDPERAGTYANRARTFENLGTSLFERGGNPLPLYTKAVQDFSDALKLRDWRVAVWADRGRIYERIGFTQFSMGRDPTDALNKALKDVRRAIVRNPNDAGAHNTCARVYVGFARWKHTRRQDTREDFRNAVAAFTESLRLQPGKRDVMFNLGNALVKCAEGEILRRRDPGDCLERALELYNRLQEMGKYKRLWNSRGLAYGLLGSSLKNRGEDPREAYKKAIADLSKAVRETPEEGMTYGQLGTVIGKLVEEEMKHGGDVRSLNEKGAQMLRKACRLAPKIWEFHSNLGLFLERCGRYDEAVQAYENALALTGNRVSGLRERLERAKAHAAKTRKDRESKGNGAGK